MTTQQSSLHDSLPIPARDRRQDRRAPTADLICDKGIILDASLCGLRLRTRCRWPEGHHEVITLSNGRDRVQVEVACIWCRQEQDNRHCVGVYFSGLCDREADLLLRMLGGAEPTRRAA